MRLGFGLPGWYRGLEVKIWALGLGFGSFTGIWARGLQFGPEGWDLGLEAEI